MIGPRNTTKEGLNVKVTKNTKITLSSKSTQKYLQSTKNSLVLNKKQD